VPLGATSSTAPASDTRFVENISVAELTESVSRLVTEFARLPGIGKKSAERLAYHVLRIHRTEAMALADAIRDVKDNVRYCRICYNLAESDQCAICRDASRQRDLLCVVEQPRDLMALEQTGVYRGLYHVLLGRIAPLEGVGPDQLTIDALVNRVREGSFQELIMATNPTVEGDGTALHISNLISELPKPIRITRLARGITSGSVLEYANKEILSDALTGRREF
jgi:recombination protein RecR